MSISLISKPTTWARVWDTNRMTYTFSANTYTQPNFQFQFNLIAWNWDGTQINLGNYNVYPSSGGTAEFNPSAIYKNYISYDYNASRTSLTEALNGARKFSLTCYEFYGTPPVRILGTQWAGEVGSGVPLNVYNGCQQNIPYDYIPLNISGNYKWVMSTGTTKGQFLTDQTEFRLSNTDLSFLYFNAQQPQRPTRIRYTLYYNCYGSGEWNTENLTGWLGMPELLTDPIQDQTLTQAKPYFDVDTQQAVEPDPGAPWTGVCSAIYYDTNISYTTFNSLQYYFPMGPYQLFKYSIFPSGYTNSWIYYKVDIMSGNTVLNTNPFLVYNTCKYDKYGKWQLTWLNPHGGFDTYTFDKKSDINYKLNKTTYKQKLPSNPAFSTYDASERVFDNQSTQEITLRTALLTQKEAQMLIQLVQSPRVYVNTIFKYSGAEYPYGVPYIIVSDSMKYENKKNDKEVYMEIKIRPANDAVLQND